MAMWNPWRGCHKEDLTLEQREKELVAGVQNEIRRFPIPTEFLQKEIISAKFEQGYLTFFLIKMDMIQVSIII